MPKYQYTKLCVHVSTARLAQSVEHGTLNPRVVGSSPTSGVPIFFFLFVISSMACTLLSLSLQQRLKEKMERKDKGGAITDQIRSGLGDTLSIEQIAAIKAKRLAKKRGTIKADDDITGGSVSFY